jgi:type IX secretion system PorP/SprF family membrane protein
MKRFLPIFSILFLFTCSLDLKAQDPVFSQFYAAPVHLNPAMSGVFDGKFRVGLNYRDQWSSVLKDNPFRTIAASFDLRQNISRYDYFSVGLSVMRDEAGLAQFQQNRSYFSFSYMKQLGTGRYRRSDQFLIAGGQVGVGQNRITWNDLWFNAQFNTNSYLPDPGNLPSGENSVMGESQTTDLFLDANAGLMYYVLFDENRSFYIGGSISHLTQPNISFLENGEDPLYSRWLGHMGGEFPFSRQLSLLPAAMVTGQGPSLQSLFGGNFRYSNNDWRELAIRLGVWGRLANQLESEMALDAVIATAILEMDRWNIGLSYDITASSFRAANNSRGAFEVSLIYVHPADRRVSVNCPKF